MASVALLNACSASENSPPEVLIKLAQTGEVMVPQNRLRNSPYFPVKRCINMGNALEADNEGDWGFKIRATDFRNIKRVGFDTVRIPIRWDAHTSRRAPYPIDPAFMERIKQVTAQAQGNGLGVILDVHHYDDLIQNPRGERARFLAIWDQIAHVFAPAPPTVYFELFNEPTNAIDMRTLNPLYADALSIIRKTNPSRAVIFGGNSWNAVDTLSAVRWPNDSNLVATFHDYGPHEFTHQGAEWSTPVMPLGRKWGGRADAADLAEVYGLAKTFQRQTGMAILVGEFGVINKVPVNERATWIRTRRKTIEAAGMSWCAWDYAGAFNMFDIQRNQWLPGMLPALMGP